MKAAPLSNTGELHNQQHWQLSGAMLGLIPWYQLEPDNDQFWGQFDPLKLFAGSPHH